MSKDVEIHAPIAIGRVGRSFVPPSPEEVIAMQQAELVALRNEFDKQTIAMRTIANICSCLINKLVGLGVGIDADSILIDRTLSDRMKGAEITVAETPDHDVVVRVRERGLDWPGKEAV